MKWVYSVFGNNEGDKFRMVERNSALANPIHFSPYTLELEIDGKKITVYHGQDRKILSSLITSKLYDVVFTGHTHQIRNEKVDGVLVVNPGTTCFASNSKIIDFASVAIYDSEKNEVRIVKF